MAAAPPPVTPSRRANVPPNIKDWIYNKALQFGYYDTAKTTTKEEKQAFISALSKKLNERHPETGAWDETRTGTQVRNLRKERSGKENLLHVPSNAAPPLVAPPPSLRPIKRLLRDWQVTLLAASTLNSTTLARHPANRGSCNEDLVRGFLSSVLGSSRLVSIGSGEVLSSTAPRQVDLLLYNTDYPCLMPARFGGVGAAACACYYPESVLAVIEVKTTLTNQDLHDVCTAAAQLAPTPFFVFAFDSQSTLRAINVSEMPDNVMGVYTLSHGSIVCYVDGWQTVLPSQTPPLEMFYTSLLEVLSAKGGPALQAVVLALRSHLEGAAVSDGTVAPIEGALGVLDLNAADATDDNGVRSEEGN